MQVLRQREGREHVVELGYESETEAREAVGAHARHVLATERHRAARRSDDPAMALRNVDFPAPFGPMIDTISSPAARIDTPRSTGTPS